MGQLEMTNKVWLEAARLLNNKGDTTLATFWEQNKVEWGKALLSFREGALSLNEEVMLVILQDCINTLGTPLCLALFEWKAWRWSGSPSFKKASTKAVYKWLCY